MPSSTSSNIENLKIHKVPNFSLWKSQYNQTNGIGTDDLVIIPPAQLETDIKGWVPSASDTAPVMDGTAAAGSATTWARADHVHPTDTSRAPTSHASSDTTYGTGTSSNYGHLKLSASTSSTSGASDGIAATPSAVKDAYDLANGKQSLISTTGILKGTGNGVITSAVAGQDYLEPPEDGDLVFYGDTHTQTMEFGVDFKEADSGQHVFEDTTNTQTTSTVCFTKGVLNGKEGLALIKKEQTGSGSTDSWWKAFWSEDYGKTWTYKGPVYGNTSVTSIQYANGVWFAECTANNTYSYLIMYSTDLITWTSMTLPSSGYSYLYNGTKVLFINNYYYFRFITTDSNANYITLFYKTNAISSSPTWGSSLKFVNSEDYVELFFRYGNYIFYSLDTYNKLYYYDTSDSNASFYNANNSITFSEIDRSNRGFSGSYASVSSTEAFLLDNNYIGQVFRQGLLKILDNNGTFSGNAIVATTSFNYSGIPVYYNGNIYQGINKTYIIPFNSSTTTVSNTEYLSSPRGRPVILNDHLCYLYADNTSKVVYIGYTANEYEDISLLKDSIGTPLVLSNELSSTLPIGYIETGTYTGNGNSSRALTLSIQPYLLFIYPTGSAIIPAGTVSSSNLTGAWLNSMLWTKGSSGSSIRTTVTATIAAITITVNGYSASWSSTSAANCLNTSNTSYSYIAIGTK